jgi:hypothetical protein
MESAFLCQVCRLIECKDEKCLYLKQGDSTFKMFKVFKCNSPHIIICAALCRVLVRPQHVNKNCLYLVSDIFYRLDRCYFNKTGSQYMLASVW